MSLLQIRPSRPAGTIWEDSIAQAAVMPPTAKEHLKDDAATWCFCGVGEFLEVPDTAFDIVVNARIGDVLRGWYPELFKLGSAFYTMCSFERWHDAAQIHALIRAYMTPTKIQGIRTRLNKSLGIVWPDVTAGTGAPPAACKGGSC